jgi:hypothetical protein
MARQYLRLAGMSVIEIEKKVRTLAPTQLERFGRWFDTYRQGARPAAANGVSEPALASAQKEEILRRLDFVEKHPESLEPWADTTQRVRRRLHEIRTEKAAARRSR